MHALLRGQRRRDSIWGQLQRHLHPLRARLFQRLPYRRRSVQRLLARHICSRWRFSVHLLPQWKVQWGWGKQLYPMPLG